jgi:hypothetical protein
MRAACPIDIFPRDSAHPAGRERTATPAARTTGIEIDSLASKVTCSFLGPFVGANCYSWSVKAAVSPFGLSFAPL